MFVLICGVIGLYFFLKARHDTLISQTRAREQYAAWQAARKATALKLPQYTDNAMEQLVPVNFRRPVSDWLENEKDFYEKVLSKGKFDVLVVPLQVMDWAMGRSIRSAMTAELAVAVAQSQKVSVADPYLVAKALGEGQRQLKQEDIYRLANSLGVKRVIWGYVGHRRDHKSAFNKFSIAILTQDAPANSSNELVWKTQIRTKRYENIAFTDEISPIEAYESILPEIIKGIDQTAVWFSPKIVSKLDVTKLPASPINLIDSDDNPARDAYTFLLFDQLTPKHVERTKELFAEKAHLALMRLSPESPEYRALRARTYMALGFRLAAIRALGTPKTDEEKELLAALNGNLAEVQAMAAKEENPLKRLIQKLDAQNIGAAYSVINRQHSIDEAMALRLPGEIWPLLVTRAFTDWDRWSQYDNASLKMLLDYELPVERYTLEEIMRGLASLGDSDSGQATLNLSVFNHGRKFIDKDADKWCCGFALNRPGRLDYLELIQGIGHDNLIRRIGFEASVQGLPDRAVRSADSIDAVYKGYPYYSVERSIAESMLAQNSDEPARAGLLKIAYEHAFNAIYWEQGQSHISTMGYEQVRATGRHDYGYFDNLYYTDIPFRPFYSPWANGGDSETAVANDLAALNNATCELDVLDDLVFQYRVIQHDDARISSLFQSLEGRFMGSPHRNELLADEALQHGENDKAIALFRDNIRIAPSYWKSYLSLGRSLFESVQVKEAAKAFLSYPGFKPDSAENRVAVANYAFDAGSYFYWSGHFDLAEPFYKIAASLDTGADAEMTSGIRLKLLAGDINEAMVGSLKRAQRYNNSYAYRDYLGILHASGYSKDAWAGFRSLAIESRQPHIWETALVGHHVAGATESEVVEWAKRSEFKELGEYKNAVAIYLLRFATTDRTPSQGLPEVIESLDGDLWQLDGYHGYVVRPTNDNSGKILGPSAGYDSSLPIGVIGSAKKHRVKSHLVYFAEGYQAIKLEDFSTAKSIFEEAAKLYDFNTHGGYMLPYFALAAAKSGDSSGVEKLLNSINFKDQGFDYHLARAILAGVGGNVDETVQSLDLARYRRPHTENRPLLTQYSFGEISELLSELTGSAKIQEIALQWAKKNQKVEPWHSWGYAIEAKLTKNPVERKRAIAMTYYLDPKSERLSKFKKIEIEDAVRAYGRLNPFLLKAKAVKNNSV